MPKQLKYIISILLIITTLSSISINSIAIGSIDDVQIQKVSYHNHCGEVYTVYNLKCHYCMTHTHEMKAYDSEHYKKLCNTEELLSVGLVPALVYLITSSLLIEYKHKDMFRPF